MSQHLILRLSLVDPRNSNSVTSHQLGCLQGASDEPGRDPGDGVGLGDEGLLEDVAGGGGGVRAR